MPVTHYNAIRGEIILLFVNNQISVTLVNVYVMKKTAAALIQSLQVFVQ